MLPSFFATEFVVIFSSSTTKVILFQSVFHLDFPMIYKNQHRFHKNCFSAIIFLQCAPIFVNHEKIQMEK